MKDRLLHSYDWLSSHRRWLWSGFTALLLPLLVLAVTLRYNEDIMDFLPVEEEDRAALEEFRAQQSASRMVLIVEGDSLREEAIEAYMDYLPDLQTEADPTEQLQALYAQLPYFIEDSVFARLDSLFTPEAVRTALQRDRIILATPGAGMLATAIQSDPLGLFPITNLQSPDGVPVNRGNPRRKGLNHQ
jgi:hypothetical protein